MESGQMRHGLVSFQDADGVNDDWLISPELNGEAQTLKFWVRTPIPNSGMETFEVYYSTTDKELSSFVKIEGIKEEAFINWEEVAAYLPEGTRYFAIRHTSVEKWLLAVDDISFIAKGATEEPLKVNGYNIYRDGIMIDTAKPGVLEYIDANVETGKSYSYNVSALWQRGESALSNTVTTIASTLDALNVNANVSVISRDMNIIVKGVNNSMVNVYTLTGLNVASRFVDGDATIPVGAKGVYIVTVGNRSFKLVVR